MKEDKKFKKWCEDNKEANEEGFRKLLEWTKKMREKGAKDDDIIKDVPPPPKGDLDILP
tara:strand:- start:338 stop:514 length:177 start_codon:yes stop_codon:yes gene_type:complete